MTFPAAGKRKSDEMNNGPSTPTGSPVPKKMKITQAQKQALMDNLQLEVTERARQLRAHYALQCQDLKSRVERRINRVPVAMRKMKMGDLMTQHEKADKDKDTAPTQLLARSPSKAPPVQPPAQSDSLQRPLPVIPEQQKIPSPIRQQAQQVIQPPKSRKRKSSAIRIPSDKENHEPDTTTEHDTSNTALDNSALPVQKNAKRAKTAATTYHNATTIAPAPKRAASKTQKKPAAKTKDTGNPMGVLSPRSHNSRTLPRSPIKDAPQPPSPTKQAASPLKQNTTHLASPFKSATTAATSALSSLAKRGAAAAAGLARPSSRDQNTATGLTGASPTGKMLPPPRPALATVTSTHAVPNMSPQRTTSQASIRSVASEQSTTSNGTNGTVVTKPTRTTTTTLTKRAPATKTTTTVKKTTAAARSKMVISETTVTPLSPKAANTGIKRTATTTTVKASGTVKRVGTTKKDVPAVTATSTGRVLRKRN